MYIAPAKAFFSIYCTKTTQVFFGHVFFSVTETDETIKIYKEYSKMDWKRMKQRTKNLEYSLYILIVSSVSVTEKKTCPKKNLRVFCAVSIFFSWKLFIFFLLLHKKTCYGEIRKLFGDTPLIWSHDSAVILLFFFVSLSPFWDLGNSTLGGAYAVIWESHLNWDSDFLSFMCALFPWATFIDLILITSLIYILQTVLKYTWHQKLSTANFRANIPKHAYVLSPNLINADKYIIFA